MNNKRICGNCFDALRLFAALSVMIGHFVRYYPLYSGGGNTTNNEIVHAIVGAFPGVPILLCLSGFLICASLENSQSIWIFCKKRILRLYPGIYACTIVYAVSIICLIWAQLDSSFIVWLCTQIFGMAYTPSCLVAFGTGSVNGALWTIMVEIQLYFVAAVSYRLLKRMNHTSWFILIFSSILISIGCQYITRIENVRIICKLIERSFLPYTIWFLVGMYGFCKKDSVIPFLKKYTIWGLALYIVAIVVKRKVGLSLPGYYVDILSGVMLPVLTLGIGFRFSYKRFNYEISYELFLYHWLILNIMIHFNAFIILGWWWSFLSFVVATFILAFVMHIITNKLVSSIAK